MQSEKERIVFRQINAELREKVRKLQDWRDHLFTQVRSNPRYTMRISPSPLQLHQDGVFLASSSKQGVAQHPADKALDAMIHKARAIDLTVHRMRDRLGDLAKLLAAVQFLPDELLSRIFTFTIRMSSDSRVRIPIKPATNQEKQYPPFLVLASVCRKWRQVALNTPEIWTSLHIKYTDTCGWPYLLVERSGDRPLDIFLDCRSKEKEMQIAPLYNVLDFIFAEAYRFSSLTVLADFCLMVYAVDERLSQVSVPQLRRLRYSLTGRGPADDQHATISRSLDNLPNLSHVRVDSVAFKWNSPSLAGLQSVDLGWLWSDTKLSFTDFQELLEASPGLTDLSLRGFYIQLSPSAQYPDVVKPSLQRLEISGDSVCGTLRLLNTPSLQSMKFANVDESEFRVLGEYFESIPKPESRYPVLQSLVLLNVKTSLPSAGFFRAMSAITHLTIINAASDEFLDGLRCNSASDHTRPPAFPQLRRLTILHDIRMEFLLGVIAERHNNGYPLQTLVLYQETLTPQTCGQFRPYVEVEGVLPEAEMD